MPDNRLPFIISKVSLVLQVLHRIFEEAGATLFIRLTFTSVINWTIQFAIAESGEEFKSEPDHLHETYVEDSFSFLSHLSQQILQQQFHSLQKYAA